MISVTILKSIDALSLILSTVLMQPKRKTLTVIIKKPDTDLRSFEINVLNVRNVVIKFEKRG